MGFLYSFALFSFSFLVMFSSQADFDTLAQAEAAAKKAARNHPKAFVAIWYLPAGTHGKVGIPTGTDVDFDVQVDWFYDGTGLALTPEKRNAVWQDPIQLPFNNGTIPGQWKVDPPQARYLTPGKYNVTVVKGTIRHMTFDDYAGRGEDDVRNNLVQVVNIGDLGYQSFHRAFAGCNNLKKVLNQGSALVGTQITDAVEMFAGISGGRGSGLEEITPNLRLKSVVDARGMFEGTNFADNGFIRLEYLFSYAKNLRDMSRMFYKSNARFVYGMWGWDTSRVSSMEMMFLNSRIDNWAGLGVWNVSSLNNMAYMFFTHSHVSPMSQISGKWDTSNVKNMEGAFAGVHFAQGTQNLGLDTSKVENMRLMFARSHNPPTRQFNTQNVTRMYRMYRYAKMGSNGVGAFQGWNLGNLTDASEFFRDAERKEAYQTNQYLTTPYFIVDYYTSFLDALVLTGPRNKKVNLRKSGKCQKTTDEGQYKGWKDQDCLNAQDTLRKRGYDIPKNQAPTRPYPGQDPHA